jgi:hypothetical protein
MFKRTEERRFAVLGLNALVGFAAVLLTSEIALAQSHDYITTFRSGTTSHVYISQSLDGEYGLYSLHGKLVPSPTDPTETVVGDDTAHWRGVGFRTAIGIELLKFIQFSAGHTFLNLRNQEDGLEQLQGSRLHADCSLVFASPIGNLEAGVGASILRADYRRMLENSSFVGSGTTYSLGTNYFMTSQLSVFAKGRVHQEHLMRNGGSATVRRIDTDTTAVSLGFRIWLN